MPTTQISLIREHTEFIKPPRALWVPFELGRPFGVPNDAAFQKKVLLAALKLFECPSGPVLEDFPEEAPPVMGDLPAWACPVNFDMDKDALTDSDRLRQAFQREMAQLRSWYDIAVKKRGRTTVGVSGLDLDSLWQFIGEFLDGGQPENPRGDLPLALVFRLAVDDLKAYYSEAVMGQPGKRPPGSDELLDWFWGETVAGTVLLAIHKACVDSSDALLQTVAQRLLVPVAQAHRTG